MLVAHQWCAINRQNWCATSRPFSNSVAAVPRGAVHRNTHLVLANAIYFRGKWEVPLYKSSTKDRPFHRHDGTVVDVPFMTNHRKYYHYMAVHDGFKVLKLPYESSTAYTQRHCMCIFLPDARDGLAGLLDKITSSSPAGFLCEHLPTRRVKVDQVLVPRFELSFSSSVTAVLKDLGLRLPFSHRADLSEMLDDGFEFRVQDVFQKAVIEVNEDGTKAAALIFYDVTAKSSQYPPEEVLFVADHPFAYFIVEEESHVILFTGHTGRKKAFSPGSQ
ncbi:putative serpin-Z8 [Aegilops tauschii subsp. strangulata]|uniref:Putative serpin-Z8 n=1 Tax=Aegilops tauschii TaxID=37682 RepID=M8BTV5_AEGTA